MTALGLASRRYAASVPDLLGQYAGDTLWALLVFMAVVFAAPALSTLRAAAIASMICLGVELSQLYHAPGIDAVRMTWAGGLVLGYGFLWSDLACYAAGVAAGVALDRATRAPETSFS